MLDRSTAAQRRSSVLSSFDRIERHGAEIACKRKVVVAATAMFTQANHLLIIAIATNGPSREGTPCSGVVGGCGCSHAEPRAIMKTIPTIRKQFFMLCKYSPCTSCANVIIDSKQCTGVIYDILTEHDTRGRDFLSEAGLVVIQKAELATFDGTSKLMKL